MAFDRGGVSGSPPGERLKASGGRTRFKIEIKYILMQYKLVLVDDFMYKNKWDRDIMMRQFEEEVSKLLSEGWILNGAVNIKYSSLGTVQSLCQALTRDY